MMGVIWGTIFGIVALIVLGIWLTRKQEDGLIEEEQAVGEKEALKALSMPVEQKLRNAIYECERNENLCKREINEVCQNQLEVLKEIGAPSYMDIKNKPLFFKYHHPLTGEVRYYYERDLNKDMSQEVLERTMVVARNHAQHIELMESKISFFQKLIASHRENLERIDGLTGQNKHIQKLNHYQAKLDELTGKTDIERNAIYNEYLLKEIHEELTFQEECFKQYQALDLEYNKPIDQALDNSFKIKIKDIINRLEEQDPSKDS
ncbi:MAG: hypothetical protein GY810_06955 [Aureispira sp.]|nr:hypothetical protein [Aureispira sp.]